MRAGPGEPARMAVVELGAERGAEGVRPSRTAWRVLRRYLDEEFTRLARD